MPRSKVGTCSQPGSIFTRGWIRGTLQVRSRPPLHVPTSRAAGIAALLDGLIGVAVLAGWTLGVETLKRFGVDGEPMRASTAAALILAAAAVLAERRAPRAASALSAAVALIGVLLGLAYAAGADLPPAARTSPNTALSLALAGAALLTLRAAPAASQALALAVAAIGAVAIAGHVFGARALYLLERGTAMSLHSAAALVLLAVAILFSRPSPRGPLRAVFAGGAAAETVRRLLIPLLSVPFVLGWLAIAALHAGLAGPELAVALVVLSSTAVLVALLLWHGRVQVEEAERQERMMSDRRFLLGLAPLYREHARSPELPYHVATALGEHLGASRCFFTEVDDRALTGTILRDHAAGLPSLAGKTSFAGFSLAQIEDARAARVLVSNDLSKDPATAATWAATYAKIGMRARISVPLRRDGRWVASFLLSSEHARVWEPREIELVQVVGDRCWAWVGQLRLEDALRASQAENAAVLETAFDPIVTLDERGVVTGTNAAARQMFEWHDGATFAETAVAPAWRDVFLLWFERLVAKPAAEARGSTTDVHAARRDGRPFPIDLSMARVEGVTPPRYTAIVRDISAMRAAEAEKNELLQEVQALARVLEGRVADRTKQLADALESVKRSEASFRAVIEHAPDGIVVHTAGRIVYANPAMRRALGVSAEGEVIGRELVELIHPGDRPRILERMHEGERDRVPKPPIEARFVAHDGGVRWMEAGGIPLPFHGQPSVLLLFRDVTERHDLERVLRENLARYQALFEDSPTSLWEEDFSGAIAHLREIEASGKDVRAHLRAHPEVVLEAAARVAILSVNRVTLEKFGATGFAQLRHGLPRIFGPETVATFRDELYAFLDGKQRFEDETVLHTLSGERRHVTVRLRVIPGHEADWSRVVVSLMDVTHLKRVEEQLRGSLAEKEVLLQEVHHRVKNNLQVVSSLLKMQQHRVQDRAALEMLDETRSRIHSIALVHEKLYGAADLAHVSFGAYVENLMESLLHALDAEARGIQATLDVAPVELSVDRAIPCGMIVNELVTNALKHAFPRDRQGRVAVVLRRVDHRYELSVADDGVGLPGELDPRDTRTLGMDLIFTFAHQLGAEVAIAREGGTRFSFVFSGGKEAQG